MNQKIHKEEASEDSKKGAGKPKYQRPERQIRNVDLQRVEEAPLNDFEREVQRKIAVMPSACDLLVREEELGLLREAIEQGGLSMSEKHSIQMTLEGLRHIDIARKLHISEGAVRSYLQRGILKIKRYLAGKESSDE